ncbi:hypothetical protein V2H45_00760 [Tumidithrix elongata RA019]|uniref:Uncharacterized protein n=1 Tax=Tumidithrix elongata BACA0141 TaxID=2716417 RepID=A0AAW9PNU9_9CYAN|nr:hypothetical protein [Tumidithrix elongata RA019]
MIWIVITINLLLSAGLLWATRQIWLLRSAFIATVRKVDGWEAACHKGLSVSPPAIMTGQKGATAAKQKYQALVAQLQKVEMVLFAFSRFQTTVKGLWSRPRKSRISRRNEQYGKRRR